MKLAFLELAADERRLYIEQAPTRAKPLTSTTSATESELWRMGDSAITATGNSCTIKE